MRSTLLATTLLATLLGLGCTEAFEPETDELDLVVSDGETKADAVSEARVRASDTTLWIDTSLVREDRDGRDTVVLSGRTSRNLEYGRGYIFDDVYGEFQQRSARTFEVTWTISEIRGLLQGVNQFVGLGFAPSAARPTNLTARVVVRPRLSGFRGTGVYFTGEVTPVVADGRTVYRLKGSTQSKIYSLALDAAGLPVAAKLLDDTHFQADLDEVQLLALLGRDAELTATAELLDRTVEKGAHLGLTVKKLGLTSFDSTEVWPPVTCSTATQGCLRALPTGTLDLASCGDAITVNACGRTVGVVADQATLASTYDVAAATLADPAGFVADAQALVGAARAADFRVAAADVVHATIEGFAGRWYLDASARTSSLATAVTADFDEVYAHPLHFVPELAPIPGNAARTRDLVADALLEYLAAQDLRQTEWSRPLEVLAREYRARHVASLREFRETAVPEGNVYVGRWLDAYVEVTVDQTTGAASNVYLEID